MTLSFHISPNERAGEFSRLPADCAEQVDFRLECLRWVARQGKGKVKVSLQRIASEKGGCFNTWYGLWSRFTKGTDQIPPGDWRHLVDRRRVSKYWTRRKSTSLPYAFLEEWRSLCARNKRGTRAVHRDLLLRLSAWRAGNLQAAIPGYHEPPPNAPGKDHPHGWSYDNLIAPKNALPPVERAAAREGRNAAKRHVPGILTTRAHSYPLAEVQFDDVWMDFVCMHPAHREPVRLLQFHCVDHFSDFLFTPATKPRMPNMSSSAMTNLNEREFRLYFFNFLATVGWSRRGSIMRMEKGTTSLRKTSKRGASLLDRLARWAPEIIVEEPGMTGASAHLGGHREREKGNPNTKALVENTHRIIHQQNGSIPGQVGMDRMHVPGDYAGRSKDATQLAAIERSMPELAGQLQSPVIRFDGALTAIHDARRTINNARDHNLEGWHEAGLMAEEVIIDQDSGLALPMSQIEATWSPQRRQLLSMMAQEDPSLLRSRRFSRREAYEHRLPDVDRQTLPREALWDLLIEDFGKTRPVIGGEFCFQSQDLAPGTHRYLATYQDLSGFTHQLQERKDYLTFVNPFDPDTLYVGDARTGALLGYCPIHRKADRTDTEAMQKEIGQAESRYQDAVRDLSQREGLRNIPGIKHNTRALENAGRSGRERRLLDAIQEAGHTPEELGIDPATLLGGEEDSAEHAEESSTANPFDPSQLLD